MPGELCLDGDVVPRLGGAACDVAESCDGAGSVSADSFAAAGTSCGSPTDGSATTRIRVTERRFSCQANNEPTNDDACRPRGGGVRRGGELRRGERCPADGFAAAGTSCGDPTNTTCNAADTCNAAGACQPNLAIAGTACSDGDVCTLNDSCNAGGMCTGGRATTRATSPSRPTRKAAGARRRTVTTPASF